MLFAEFSVTSSAWMDVFFILAVIVAAIGLVLAFVKAPVDLMLFVFGSLVFGWAGLLCQ